MKIIAGEKKGHIIQTPPGALTRPTLSRVRESLFSIIAGDVPDARFYELYAGSGSIGLEALSRGARSAVFVEEHRLACACLRENISRLKYTDQATLIQSDVLKWTPPGGDQAPDIIFADPPYDPAATAAFFARAEQWTLKADTLLIVQTAAKYKPDSTLHHLRSVSYGNTALHFYLGKNSAAGETADQPATGSR